MKKNKSFLNGILLSSVLILLLTLSITENTFQKAFNGKSWQEAQVFKFQEVKEASLSQKKINRDDNEPFCDTEDPDELICNGGFELNNNLNPSNFYQFGVYNGPTEGYHLYCGAWNEYGSSLLYWQPFFCEEGSVNAGAAVVYEDNPGNAVLNGNYSGDVNLAQTWSFISRLKHDLELGATYELSYNSTFSDPRRVGFNVNGGFANSGSWNNDVLDYQLPTLSNSQGEVVGNNWRKFTKVFVADDVYRYFIIGNHTGKIFLDDISLKKIENPACVSDCVNIAIATWCDIDGDGNKDGEVEGSEWSMMPNMLVGFYDSSGNIVATSNTSSVGGSTGWANVSLPPGVYYVGLVNESNPPQAYEFSYDLNSDIFPDHNFIIVVDSEDESNSIEYFNGIPYIVDDIPIQYGPGCQNHISVGSGQPSPVITKQLRSVNAAVNGGQTNSITWRVIVENPGGSNISNINVGDNFPPGTTYGYHSIQTYSPTGNWIQSSSSFNLTDYGGILNIPYLYGGQRVVLDITLNIPSTSCGEYMNSIFRSFYSGGQFFPNALIAESSAVIDCPGADTWLNNPTNIGIKKDLIDSYLSLFDRYITWRVLVYNTGPGLGTNIRVGDILPEDINYHIQNSQNDNITYNQNEGVITVTSLEPNTYTYIDITTRVPKRACGRKTNIATLISLDQSDTSLQDNSASKDFVLDPCGLTKPGGRFPEVVK